MSAGPLDGVISATTVTLVEWEKFLVWINGSLDQAGHGFDLDKPIPGQAPETSINTIAGKLSGAVALARTLSPVQSVDLIPDTIVAELGSRTTAVRAGVEKLLAHVSALEEGVPLTSVDPANMTASNEKGQSANLPPIFHELYPAIQGLLVALYQMRSMSGLSRENGPLLAVSHIDAARNVQRKVFGEVTRLRKAVETTQTRVGKTEKAAEVSADEVEKLKAKATEAVTKSDEAKDKADAVLEEVAQINTEAGQVKGAVEAYSETFAKFQTDLDAGNAAFQKGQQNIDKLLEEAKRKYTDLIQAETDVLDTLKVDLKPESNDMDRLLARARDILGEATAAGLSERFAEEKNAVGSQIIWNQILYFFSIIFLFFSAGVVLNAFPWLEGYLHLVQIQPASDANLSTVTAFYLVNFFSKLTFLLPALLLFIFAGRRYTELFRLKAQYTYKYTVAASLPGFKLEAPTYAEAITASAFKELLFNPGAAIAAPEEKSKKEGNTFLERLIEPAVKKALDKMGEVKGSAD